MTNPPTTDRTKSALAVLGKPDARYAYDLGGVRVPYLALSFEEMDLIDAIPIAAPPEDADDEEIADFMKRKRALEAEAAYHLLSRRLGDKGPKDLGEVYGTLNTDLVWDWFNNLLRGDKGEEVGTPAGPQPRG